MSKKTYTLETAPRALAELLKLNRIQRAVVFKLLLAEAEKPLHPPKLIEFKKLTNPQQSLVLSQYLKDFHEPDPNRVKVIGIALNVEKKYAFADSYGPSDEAMSSFATKVEEAINSLIEEGYVSSTLNLGTAGVVVIGQVKPPPREEVFPQVLRLPPGLLDGAPPTETSSELQKATRAVGDQVHNALGELLNGGPGSADYSATVRRHFKTAEHLRQGVLVLKDGIAQHAKQHSEDEPLDCAIGKALVGTLKALENQLSLQLS